MSDTETTAINIFFKYCRMIADNPDLEPIPTAKEAVKEAREATGMSDDVLMALYIDTLNCNANACFAEADALDQYLKDRKRSRIKLVPA